MENGTKSWVAKVGILRIGMFDGPVWIVNGVRHVPVLKKN